MQTGFIDGLTGNPLQFEVDFLYSYGESPICFLKNLENWNWSVYPTYLAISLIEYKSDDKSSQAFEIRILFR